jgi:hypothetical protein
VFGDDVVAAAMIDTESGGRQQSRKQLRYFVNARDDEINAPVDRGP